jgi:hypothetical protein
MSDDDVREALSLVRDHVRAERADDAALEALARGDESSPQVVKLVERAANDREAAALVDASRPLGADAEERIAARLSPKPMVSTSAAAAPKPGRVLAFVRRSAVYVAPLAVAAAVLVYVGRGDTTHASLPDYSVVATSEKEMRGADPAAAPHTQLELRGGTDAVFELVVRPATSVPVKVVAYVFAIGEGEPNAVDAKVEVAPEGAVRISGRARALAGAREVRVVLGPASDFKRYEDALSRAREGKSDAQVRVLVVPIIRTRP